VNCRRCNSEMKTGIALKQGYGVGLTDFPGQEISTPEDLLGQTMGPVNKKSTLVEVTKCSACGHSFQQDRDWTEGHEKYDEQSRGED